VPGPVLVDGSTVFVRAVVARLARSPGTEFERSSIWPDPSLLLGKFVQSDPVRSKAGFQILLNPLDTLI